MRAVAQDRDAARLMGIGVDRMFVLTWIIAGLLTGAAGILVGPMWFADVNMGDPIALKAFAAIIIGGFSSVPGAIVGGILVGLAEMTGRGLYLVRLQGRPRLPGDDPVPAGPPARHLRRTHRPTCMKNPRMRDRRSRTALLAAGAVFVAALVLPAFISGYGIRILNLALISAIAVMGLNFAFGYAGLITLAQAGFRRLRRLLITAILSTTAGLSPWLSIPIAVVATGLIAVVIGLPMLRLKGHYLALATLGFNVSFVIVATNWKSVMGGTDGISGIPSLALPACRSPTITATTMCCGWRLPWRPGAPGASAIPISVSP